MIIERFFADTGANRSVHPDIKAANKYFPLPLDIGTASGSKTLKSEGVGTMDLQTTSGEPVAGFHRVIFCKNVAEKLCSVGEMCDAGYVFVFDENKLVSYSKTDFKVTGKMVTSDLRDPRTKLYPITFHRRTEGVGEKKSKKNAIPLIASVAIAPPPTTTPVPFDFCEQKRLPLVIVDEPLNSTFLAKSYKHPDLSQIDKYHAKLGDIGIKYMKRCMPTLKIPSQYRCDVCISGKIHKFGHKKCAEGVR